MTHDDHLWLQKPYSMYHVDKYNRLRGQTTSLPGTAGACSISIFKTWLESLSKDIGRWEPIAEGDPSILISAQSWSKLSSPEIYYYLLQVYYRTYEPWFPLTVKENPVKVCSSAFRGNECNKDFFRERITKMQETVDAFFSNLCDPRSLPSCLNFNLSLWCLWRQCNFPLPKCNFQMKSWNILFQFPRRRRSLIQMSIYKWFRRWRAAPAGQEQFQFQSAGQHHWH